MLCFYDHFPDVIARHSMSGPVFWNIMISSLKEAWLRSIIFLGYGVIDIEVSWIRSKVIQTSMSMVEDWSRYLGLLKSCPKMGQFRVAKMLPPKRAEKCKEITYFWYGITYFYANMAHLGRMWHRLFFAAFLLFFCSPHISCHCPKCLPYAKNFGVLP